MNTQSGNAHLHNMWGEIALITAVTINSFGVVLMLYSAAGISAISSVPYAFSLVLPRLTLGTWTYIFQGVLILTLMIMRRKFVPQYLCSFIVGFVFGKMLDIHEMWIGALPTALPWRILYFVISYILICIGIALSNRCRTDFADIQNKKECGGNRQWQRQFLRNWAANTKGKGII